MVINVKGARRARVEKEMIDGSADEVQLGKSKLWPRNLKVGEEDTSVLHPT